MHMCCAQCAKHGFDTRSSARLTDDVIAQIRPLLSPPIVVRKYVSSNGGGGRRHSGGRRHQSRSGSVPVTYEYYIREHVEYLVISLAQQNIIAKRVVARPSSSSLSSSSSSYTSSQSVRANRLPLFFSNSNVY